MLTEVLGGNGARNYLIEQVNPAELRPGGGFIGTFSVLRADHGALNQSGLVTHTRSLIREPRSDSLVTSPHPVLCASPQHIDELELRRFEFLSRFSVECASR